MKRLALASVLISMGAFGACAVEEPAATGDGTLAGTGPVAGSPASGGNAGVGVQGGTAGVGVQGGTAGSTGGDVSTGGSVVTGGTAGDTGMGGTAGDTGMGGMLLGGQGGTAGDTGMGGMVMGGMGGMTMGGMGGMAMGGMGGMGGGGGQVVTCPTPPELFPMAPPTGQTSGLTGNVHPPGAPAGSLDGYLIHTPCADTNCDDCGGDGWYYKGIRRACNADGNGLNAIQNFTVGGTPGTPYNVTLHFYGIAEPKNYGGSVTRQAGTQRPNQNDQGATPHPWAYANGNPNYQQSDYNTYEVHVVDNNGMEVCSYFLNSDTSEGHWTYVINYERTITVIGGGRVRIRVYDRNCRMIKNCMSGGTQGACNATGCNNKARTLDAVNQANPPPMGLMQPGLGNDANQAGQWLYIDVTNVQCTSATTPRLACNGMPMQ